MKSVVKRMVQEGIKRVIEEWTLILRRIRKKNWKGVNEVKKGDSRRFSSVRNLMGEG